MGQLTENIQRGQAQDAGEETGWGQQWGQQAGKKNAQKRVRKAQKMNKRKRFIHVGCHL